MNQGTIHYSTLNITQTVVEDSHNGILTERRAASLRQLNFFLLLISLVSMFPWQLGHRRWSQKTTPYLKKCPKFDWL